MGFIKKFTRKIITIRNDTFQVISPSDAKNLNPDIVERRDEFIIIVYPESRGEFEYFHNKHILGILEENQKEITGTILVANKELIIKDKSITQILLQQALEDAKLKENIVVHTGVPQPLILVKRGFRFYVRRWDYSKKQFISDPKDCCFTFRDIKDVSSKNEILKIKEYISTNEFNQILNFLKNCKIKGETYFVTKVWFVGHYHVSA